MEEAARLGKFPSVLEGERRRGKLRYVLKYQGFRDDEYETLLVGASRMAWIPEHPEARRGPRSRCPDVSVLEVLARRLGRRFDKTES
jgi:hypothetical protein